MPDPQPGQLVRCHADDGFAEALFSTGGSLLVSTYQANKIAAIGCDASGRVSVVLREFDKPMGMAVAGNTVAIGTRNDIVLLENAPQLAVTFQSENKRKYDGLFVPRVTIHTGDVAVHELALSSRDELLFVNTRFSCVCRVNPRFNFEPVWQPWFITQLAPEDRCHLNGLAIENDLPRFATCLGETDEIDGWRAGKALGGCLIDIELNGTIVRGLSMPHSPRCFRGGVILLNSGEGEVLAVHIKTGLTSLVAKLPAYLRGLDFGGSFAFVGMSMVRDRGFAGLPIQSQFKELLCGVAAIDMRTGATVGLLRFTSGCTEVFDVKLLPGVRVPMVLNHEQAESRHAFTAPEFSYWIRPVT